MGTGELAVLGAVPLSVVSLWSGGGSQVLASAPLPNQ